MTNYRVTREVFLYRSLGIVILVLGAYWTITQIFRAPFVAPSLFFSYLGLILLALGWLVFIYSYKEARLTKRRNVDRGEVASLLTELHIRPSEGDISAPSDYNENDILLSRDRDYTELEVLPLRQYLVELYPVEYLITKTNYEIEGLLKEYVDAGSFDENKYEKWKSQINVLINKIIEYEENSESKTTDTGRKFALNQLRSELKTLRETVAQYDKSWAEGEQYRDGVIYGGIVATLSFILMGLLPVIHLRGSGDLEFLSWFLLGIGGGLGSRLISIHDEDLTEIGETQGKQLLKSAGMSILTGGITALLLYGVLQGGLIKGPIFPEFNEHEEPLSRFEQIMQTGLSVFWGIFSGFSLRVLAALTKLGESAIGRSEESS